MRLSSSYSTPWDRVSATATADTPASSVLAGTRATAPTRLFWNCWAARRFSTRKKRSAPKFAPRRSPKPRRPWKMPKPRHNTTAALKRRRKKTRRSSHRRLFPEARLCAVPFFTSDLDLFPTGTCPRVSPAGNLVVTVIVSVNFGDGFHQDSDRHCRRRRCASGLRFSGLSLVAKRSGAGAGAVGRSRSADGVAGEHQDESPA